MREYSFIIQPTFLRENWIQVQRDSFRTNNLCCECEFFQHKDVQRLVPSGSIEVKGDVIKSFGYFSLRCYVKLKE